MPIIRVKKRRSFIIVSKEVANDKTISMRAKGMYLYLMGLPNDWVIHMSEIEKHFQEGRRVCYGALNDLMKHGYVHKEYIREKNRLSMLKYTIYEEKSLNPNRKS